VKSIKNKKIRFFLIFGLFIIFQLFSFGLDYYPGEEISINFLMFIKSMMGILPAAFILIGLFEVWVSKEKIEAHMGAGSGIRGYLWALVLAGPKVGGLYVAFPIAVALAKKGASLSVILFYISAAAIYRIPMTLIEASFLGVKFTLIRLFVALPLIFGASVLFAKVLEKQNYQIREKSDG